jgi:hypothetical protein
MIAKHFKPVPFGITKTFSVFSIAIYCYFMFFRTIIEPYFKCLARMFPACNVTDLAKTLMMSQHFADKLPTESTLLGCLEGLFCNNIF